MELTTEILKSKENNLHTASVFLDLSKAFDTLDPKILTKKLEIYGLRGVVLNGLRATLRTDNFESNVRYPKKIKHNTPTCMMWNLELHKDLA